MTKQRRLRSSDARRESRGALLTTRDVAQFLRVNEDSVRWWRYRGIGPQYIKFGSAKRCRVRYRMSDVAAWLEGQLVRPRRARRRKTK